MRALAMTGMDTASMIWSIMSGSDMRDTPPWARMSAGTRSSAITAEAPASSAMRACSALTTSMMTPPLSISGKLRLTRRVPVCCSTRCCLRRLGPRYRTEGVSRRVLAPIGLIQLPKSAQSTRPYLLGLYHTGDGCAIREDAQAGIGARARREKPREKERTSKKLVRSAGYASAPRVAAAACGGRAREVARARYERASAQTRGAPPACQGIQQDGNEQDGAFHHLLDGG